MWYVACIVSLSLTFTIRVPLLSYASSLSNIDYVFRTPQ